MWSQPEQLAMTNHAQGEQAGKVQHQLLRERESHAGAARDQNVDQRDRSQRHQCGERTGRAQVPARMIEADDER
jgi:hypothetical protein